MTKKSVEHYGDPGEWDEEVERRPGSKASAVFSVRFTREEIADVRQAASRAGERTSEFIRVAALTRARRGRAITVILQPSVGAPPGGAIVFARPGPSTRATSETSEFEYAQVA